jgi:GGDEF domain-containing protein
VLRAEASDGRDEEGATIAHLAFAPGFLQQGQRLEYPEGLIQKADQAMYRVKERDKNGIEVAV